MQCPFFSLQDPLFQSSVMWMIKTLLWSRKARKTSNSDWISSIPSLRTSKIFGLLLQESGYYFVSDTHTQAIISRYFFWLSLEASHLYNSETMSALKAICLYHRIFSLLIQKAWRGAFGWSVAFILTWTSGCFERTFLRLCFGFPFCYFLGGECWFCSFCLGSLLFIFVGVAGKDYWSFPCRRFSSSLKDI
jgi:hypothetical protein